MLLRRFIWVLLVLLLLGGLAWAQSHNASFVVEVKGAAGRPVRDACVTLIPKEGEILFGKADRKGQFKLKNIQAGNYRVVVKADGYEAQKREVAVGTGGADTVSFSMQPRGASQQR